MDALSRKELEAEILRLSKEKDEAELKVTQLENNAKSISDDFLENMSHEIRTTLNSIIGFSDILKNLIKNKKQKQFLNIISNGGINLLNLFNNIIDISKIESKTLSLVYTDFNVNNIIKEVITELQLLKPKIEIENKVSIKNLRIYADKARTKQIFTNLLNNSLKFTESGKVTIGYNLNKENIEFYIEDTGVGIDESEINNIFSGYVSSDNSINKVNAGAGLGLVITKSLVELHNGKIWVESKKDIGSMFKFSYPISSVKSEIIESNTSRNDIELECNNKKILIAEDNDENYLLLEILLNKNELKRAKNGFEAIELHKSFKPDIILMDIQMPECNGFEATREIRLLDKKTPIIGQSAFAIQNPSDNLLKKGFDFYISKPITKYSLYSVLNNLTF